MLSESVVFIGIDVHETNLTIACLNDSLEIEFIEHLSFNTAIDRLMSTAPQIIAVDAPFGLNRGFMSNKEYRNKLRVRGEKYQKMRVCEYELSRRNIQLHSTPGKPDDITNWKKWMKTGFALYDNIMECGYRPYSQENESCDRVVIEVFPHACFTTLAGRIMASKKTPSGLDERKSLLESLGVTHLDESLFGSRHDMADKLDAAVSAYTTYAVFKGTATFLGDPQEGLMVLPVKEIKDKYRKVLMSARYSESPNNFYAAAHQANFTYEYIHDDSVLWYNHFKPLLKAPNIEDVIKVNENSDRMISFRINSCLGDSIEASFEPMSGGAKGLKVVKSHKKMLSDYWGSHGDKKMYRITLLS